MRIVGVAASIALGCWLPTIAATQDASETPPALLSLRDDCLRQFAQPKFAAIHDKVPYLTRSSDLKTLLLPVKPTATERAAIRSFLPIAVACEKRSLELSEPGQAPIMYVYQISESATIGGLALLAAGEITYMEYGMIVDMKAAEPEAIRQAIAKQRAERETQENAIITLSCVVQGAQDMLAQMNGTEFQYTVDPAHNTASASRGPGPPRNVQVSPTLITFVQADMAVTISRATGRVTWQVKNNPFAISGLCEAIHAAKF